MRPTRSKRESPINRVNELNLRVKDLVSTDGLEDSDSLLVDEAIIGLRALRVASTKRPRRRYRDNVARVLSTCNGLYPKLVEDILLLIVEAISPRVDMESFPTSNDITTLKSMRL
jgi:hypothetical protein